MCIFIFFPNSWILKIKVLPFSTLAKSILGTFLSFHKDTFSESNINFQTQKNNEKFFLFVFLCITLIFR